MERKLATIEKITGLYPIDGADSIERATVRGWNVVVKKGDFSVNDLVIYCEIDSLLPDRPEFEFLRPRGFRIKTIKLRGQVSQGIIFPLSVLPMSVIIFETPEGTAMDVSGITELGDIRLLIPGTDITDVLGITKYEAPIPAELAGQVLGAFPSHSIKTDEERIQNLKDNFEDYKKEIWIATEKLDGTSSTYSIFNDIFGVSSRNLELKETENNTFWKVARRINLEELMRKYMLNHGLKALTLQGELIGEGIQGNKYKIKGQDVRFFRAFDPIAYKFFEYEEFINMMKEMGLTTVPLIDLNFSIPENYEDLILYADGKSMIAETAREGVVFVSKSPAEKYQGRLSFKVISNKFILKHDE